MAGIERTSFDRPDEVYELKHGRMDVVRIGDQEVWRSVDTPGWNWERTSRRTRRERRAAR